MVALLAEGVDRNFVDAVIVGPTAGSPSSRRAWIEIYRIFASSNFVIVALLAEGVDRNCLTKAMSLSCHVALLAEGVDRNRFHSFP